VIPSELDMSERQVAKDAKCPAQRVYAHIALNPRAAPQQKRDI